jgi:uncharacterized iron-regulated membrane protein
LAAPPRTPDARIGGAIAILVVASILFPVLGASVLVVAIVDRLVLAMRRRRARNGYPAPA